MFRPSRRNLIAGTFASALMPSAVRSVAAAVKPVKITGVDIFPIRLPASKEDIDAGKMASYVVCRDRYGLRRSRVFLRRTEPAYIAGGAEDADRARPLQRRRSPEARLGFVGWS